jgi:hypothetical protein
MKLSIYRLATGRLTGGTIDAEATSPEEALALLNDPSIGLVDGEFDWQSQTVDLATGEVVDWQPERPADDERQTWRWDSGTRRWVSEPTILAIGEAVRVDRDRRLAECDWVVARAFEMSEPVRPDWALYRSALRELPQQAGFPTAIEWPDKPA